MRDNGDEMSENPQASPSIEEGFVDPRKYRAGRLWVHTRKEIANMGIADADLVWWIQMGGTCCFLVGVLCLLVAHILGRPQ